MSADGLDVRLTPEHIRDNVGAGLFRVPVKKSRDKAARSADGGRPEAGHELEIKFRTDLAGFEQAKRLICGENAAGLSTKKLRSRYFDTRSGSLRKAGVGLRLRSGEGKGQVQTVKSVGDAHGGPFRRREAEAPASGHTPDISQFDKKSAAFLGRLIGKESLSAQAETSINRQIASVQTGGSLLEVAFDDGVAKAGSRKLSITEIELELKSGNAADLCTFAIVLAEKLPLRLDFSSKAAKAFGLLTGNQPAVVKAKPVLLSSTMDLAATVPAILANVLEHFVGNWPVFDQTGQPEAIHQLRVALRRMRLALSLFGRELEGEVFETLREKAKHIAAALGHVREIDVFRENAEKLSLMKRKAGPDLKPLLLELGNLRQQAYRDACIVMGEAQTTVFALEVQRTASIYWQSPTGTGRETLEMPVLHFAENALQRLHERVLKRGEHFAKMDAEQRHELRIAFKNLRYAADFFSSLYSANRRTRTYLACVAAIQDVLGAQNDAVMAAQFAEGNLAGLGDAQHAAVKAVVQAQAIRKSSGERALVKRWRTFKEAEIFWS